MGPQHSTSRFGSVRSRYDRDEMQSTPDRIRPADLAAMLEDARARTLALVEDLDDGQLMGPRLAIVNPLLWEIGHVAWFQEKWALRHLRGAEPLRADADALYDSSAVAHDTRWDLPLPSRTDTLAYMRDVLASILDRLAGRAELSREEAYFHYLALFHEDMHDEAFTYTRQTLRYPAPRLGAVPVPAVRDPSVAGDVVVEGGVFPLGAARDEPFVFDNEKWVHDVAVATFAISRLAVTEGDFAAFADDGGYRRGDLWSDAGRAWLERDRAGGPAYWERGGDGRWWKRRFDAVVPLDDDHPMVHVNAHEAEAYCRWAGRRLPSEAEWETAASLAAGRKRRYPWGSSPPDGGRANLDGAHGGTAPVSAFPGGDGPAGCRQMLGNVWEWTSSPFLPYPGFVPDPYADYSQPWFGDHRVLRGGCFLTRSRLIRNTWRNFYTPERRDVWAGFRTCAA